MESLKKNVCHRWDTISDIVTCSIERWGQSKWHHEYNRILSKMRTAAVELWSLWSTSNFYVFFSLHSISNKISSSCSFLQVSFLLKAITHDHTSFPENKLLIPFCLTDMKLGWASLVTLSPEEAGQGSEGVGGSLNGSHTPGQGDSEERGRPFYIGRWPYKPDTHRHQYYGTSFWD